MKIQQLDSASPFFHVNIIEVFELELFSLNSDLPGAVLGLFWQSVFLTYVYLIIVTSTDYITIIWSNKCH